MNVYVSSKTDHGKSWLVNPEPYFNGSLLLLFGPKHAEAGVPFKRHGGSKSLMKRLTDELDRAKVPWVNLHGSRTGVMTVEGKDHEFFLMSLDLTGPLPKEIADDMKCEARRKSLGLRHSIRYGG